MRTLILALLFFGLFLTSSYAEGLNYANPLRLTQTEAREQIRLSKYRVGRIYSCRRVTSSHWRCRTEAQARVQYFYGNTLIHEERYYVPATADVGWKGVRWSWQ